MQSPKLRVIRKSSYTATPWKNGGGITHEAMRMPARGDPFRWRVSVAHIDASGPFSDFAGYDRKMVLLRGSGIELRFADGVHRTLRQAGDLVEFDGALGAHCDLLAGPCVDLNLMVLKSDTAAVRVERIIESSAVVAAPGETVLIVPVDGEITLQTDAGETAALEHWDLAVLSQGGGRLAAAQSAATAVFVARLNIAPWEPR